MSTDLTEETLAPSVDPRTGVDRTPGGGGDPAQVDR